MYPKIIHSEAEYEQALAYVETLMDAETDSPEEDELEIWTLLIENYEETHYPIPPPDPVEAIRFRMDQLGLNPSDLAPYIKSKSKISEVLNRKRSLSLTMIRALHQGLGIPAEILVREPDANYTPHS
jgi:HTH-type transcriptional regulator/antitoxin HigA